MYEVSILLFNYQEGSESEFVSLFYSHCYALSFVLKNHLLSCPAAHHLD